MADVSPRPGDPTAKNVRLRQPRVAADGWSQERKVFLLESLAEITREISGQATPSGIIRAFLPLAMGPLGLTSGFAALCTEPGETLAFSSRGLEPDEADRFLAHAPTIAARFFAYQESQGTPPSDYGERPVLLTGQHLGRDDHLPGNTEVMAMWSMADGLRGLLVLGGRLSGEPMEPEEVDYLEKLIDNMGMALRCARNAESVARLNRDLAERGDHLERALGAMAKAQDELDHRAFHLSVRFETTRELAGELDPGKAMDTFLKTVAGTFGLERAFLAVLDDAAEAQSVAAWSLDNEERAHLATPQARKDLLGLFVSFKDRIPRPMESRLLAVPPAGLPGGPRVVLLFALDEACRGVLAMGPRFSGQDLNVAELDLLRSQLDSFMVSLKSARHHATAQRLNADLIQRNRELGETIAQLTNARQEIDLLQAAKARISAALRGEVERLGRFSWRGLAFIFMVSLALGLLYNLVSPGGVEIVPRALFTSGPAVIAVEAARTELAAGRAVLIDARPAEFHQQEHIRGAVNLPPALFDFVYAMRFAELPLDAPIIVYGRSVSLHYDRQVAEKLALRGHEAVMVLDGDFKTWRQAGLPMEIQGARP